MTAPKLIIIGLDSVPPVFSFEKYRQCTPHLQRLRRKGISGALRSTDPPITIPAWISMTSGRSPADLGIYGFRLAGARGRKMRIASAADVRHSRLWDLALDAGLTCAVVSVPLTYPPPSRPGLAMTSDFLTPDPGSPFASDPSLREELNRLFGAYLVDVDHFRDGDFGRIEKEVHAFSRQHFGIFRHLIASRHPDFAMLVDLGPDRFHHALLSRMTGDVDDPGADYYRLLDDQLGETIALADDDTLIMIVSDHGVKPLQGVFCINEFLIRTGYLVLKRYPEVSAPLSKVDVDWEKTTAWGEGGYHGRVFLNTKARSPESRMTTEDAAAVLRELKDALSAVVFPDQRAMNNRVFCAEDLYGSAPEGFPPDLTVYFDDLNLRCAGTVGRGALFEAANDTGADDANHDYCGIYVAARVGAAENDEIPVGGERPIYDVFATALHALGLAKPPGTLGEVIVVP